MPLCEKSAHLNDTKCVETKDGQTQTSLLDILKSMTEYYRQVTLYQTRRRRDEIKSRACCLKYTLAIFLWIVQIFKHKYLIFKSDDIGLQS